MEDFDHNKPEYLQLNDSGIVNAYLSHLYYLVDKFEPNYLVYSIESNELLVNNPTLWPAFRSLMDSVGFELKEKYPNLKMSESVTLHSWYKADQGDDYIKEVDKIANSGDFTAISFYPFFKGLHTHNEFQKAFDFLHNRTNLPIAFVETNHLGEDLFIENLSLDIKGNENEQRDYLETLLINANKENYEFVIWWAYRDYDALWKTFPAEIKDLGQIWRDTGLKDEAGEDRKSMKVWREIFAK
jgi:hypothetical protein